MAAPMKNAVWKLCRRMLANMYKLNVQKQYIPAASFCEESTESKKQTLFDVTTLEPRIKETTEHEEGSSEKEESKTQQETQSFATLFRNSKFVQLGDLKDRLFAGRIFHVVGEDLYIDFGGKFYCVCSRPALNANQYVKGRRVRLMVHKFEMSSGFLGSDKHLTLQEADATLLGLFDQVKGKVMPDIDGTKPADKDSEGESKTGKSGKTQSFKIEDVV